MKFLIHEKNSKTQVKNVHISNLKKFKIKYWKYQKNLLS